jgi:hypothetical protein
LEKAEMPTASIFRLCLSPIGFVFGLFFDPEEEGNMFPRNIGIFVSKNANMATTRKFQYQFRPEMSNLV